MLSDKKSGKFRGVAFVEVADRASLTAAVALHQSRCDTHAHEHAHRHASVSIVVRDVLLWHSKRCRESAAGREPAHGLRFSFCALCSLLLRYRAGL